MDDEAAVAVIGQRITIADENLKQHAHDEPWPGYLDELKAHKRSLEGSLAKLCASTVAALRAVGVAAVQAVVAAVLIGAAAGCSSGGGGQGEYEPPAVTMPPAPAYTRTALVVGLSRVRPDAYGDWAGHCGNCVREARDAAALTERCGVATCLLLDSEATRARIKGELLNLILNASPGGLVCVIMSGHGGQRDDRNGDETEDGLDEYFCAFDGPILDDEFFAILLQAGAIRVALFFDTCNAGSMHMAVMAGGRQTAGWRVEPREFEGLRCGVVYLGASTDGTPAYDAVFLPRLVRTWAVPLSYTGWFGRTVEAIAGASQVPTYSEHGPAEMRFGADQALW